VAGNTLLSHMAPHVSSRDGGTMMLRSAIGISITLLRPTTLPCLPSLEFGLEHYTIISEIYSAPIPKRKETIGGLQKCPCIGYYKFAKCYDRTQA